MEMRTRNRPPETHPPEMAPGGGNSPGGATTDHCNVLVTTGIHRGRFPVGSMTIRQARVTLSKLIKIDPQAVPVINGAQVEEDTVIGPDVTMLSFVKPSSLKG
jgi:hypothetical protein